MIRVYDSAFLHFMNRIKRKQKTNDPAGRHLKFWPEGGMDQQPNVIMPLLQEIRLLIFIGNHAENNRRQFELCKLRIKISATARQSDHVQMTTHDLEYISNRHPYANNGVLV